MAGPFVGTHNGALLVAGGANFPGKLPWEGGTKVWHDTIFALEKTDSAWKVAGKDAGVTDWPKLANGKPDFEQMTTAQRLAYFTSRQN